MGLTRFVCISDTHGRHEALGELPDGDVLIHSGDACGRFDDFAAWFASQPHEHKVYVPGNHDQEVEDNPLRAQAILGSSVALLIEEEIEINGLRIWGSPWTPQFWYWSFMYPQTRAEETWAKIPQGIDVLVTHGPPRSVLDQVRPGLNAGCPVLNRRVFEVRPKAHVFGHIHEGWGQATILGIKFVNAAVMDGGYRLSNVPQVFEIPDR